ncbi:MAG TPA: CarD family transcriptional regulator, partial [Bacteroidota bacterium]|nr:CarD family transcriptional regulator [Bacteroidota bacterium]
GFVKQQYVQSVGEYAVRGGILDVYPFVGDNPVRIEFDGDVVESVREFDPLSQRSMRELSAARIVPDLFSLTASPTAILLDYIRSDAFIVLQEPMLDASYEPGQTHEAPQSAIRWVDLLQRCESFAQLHIRHTEVKDEPVFDFHATPQPAVNSSMKVLRAHIAELQARGYRVVITGDTDAEIQRLKELLAELEPLAEDEELQANAPLHIVDVGSIDFTLDSLHRGFVFPDARLALFTEHQIFNRLKRRGKTRRAKSRGLTRKDILELRKGDFVVHTDFGIGQFEGLQTITVGNVEHEVLKLRYEEKDTVYVNLNYLHKVQKYSSRDGHVPKLTRLGSGEWDRMKARAKKRVKDIARDLIALYAKRKALPGFSFAKDTLWQRELEASFIYEDTPDQARATEEVKQDMESPHPMDRLICGDVGFGKTEVAVRAAFKAVMSGKQVALLVPTTILAMQHYQTFRDRLSRYTTHIEVLSRFRTPKEQKAILQHLQAGTVDIIIGTHRLL